MEIIMKDASQLLTRMADSRKFSYDLMSAAQASQQDKVLALIKSTGIQQIPTIKYTPDGLQLHFESVHMGKKCCHLSLFLRWSK